VREEREGSLHEVYYMVFPLMIQEELSEPIGTPLLKNIYTGPGPMVTLWFMKGSWGFGAIAGEVQRRKGRPILCKM
jgi:hypothetical protein